MDTCRVTTDGQHVIEWCEVPAQVWNPGASDEWTAYDSHERGLCLACREVFARVS